MVGATGMTGGVISLVDRYAPPGVREELMAHLMAPSYEDGWDGAMFMTELRGGSDLATTETVARPAPGGDERTWLLNGAKWFCSNVDARAIATLARPEGAEPGLRDLALFLVPATRADGSPNGVRIKRIKDKLGTRALATGEIAFDGALAVLQRLGAGEWDTPNIIPSIQLALVAAALAHFFAPRTFAWWRDRFVTAPAMLQGAALAAAAIALRELAVPHIVPFIYFQF
jgi:alkylation response protein AidB-like acyl-CoA dehydrogenase